MQTVLITGARGGIGRACVERLIKAGYLVVACDRDVPDDVVALEEAIRHGGTAHVEVQLDVTDGRSVADLAERLERARMTPVALVNAAGILQDIQPLADLEDEVHDRVWSINYSGTYRCCKAFGLSMARAGRGSIVNISSINAYRATPLLAYAPGKAAINALTACLAAELGPSGVRVNAIAPGFTLTPVLAQKLADGRRDPRRILDATALHRWVSPEDIANTVHFLCTADAGAITGVSIPVDAGWLAASSWHTFGGVRHDLPRSSADTI